MKILMYGLLMVLLTNCAHKFSKVPDGSDLAYPYGKYQHKVKVELIEAARKMNVSGVIESHEDQLRIVGISSFGTTVFRIDENLKTGELNKEFYVEALRKNEDRVMFFYSLMKELLKTPKETTEFERQGARFILSGPDENKIYRHVAINHPQVNLDIEVTGYEL
jgi:hypothetical protein